MTIEAVIFDWGGTLTPWNSLDPHDAWRAYASTKHADDDGRAAELAATLAAAEAARWATVRDSHRAFTTAELIADAEAGHDPSALEAYRDFWVQATRTDPEAAPMLAELRERGLLLGVLSSTAWPAQWHEDWLRRDGVFDLFDACVWSSDLAYTKPHPTAFRAAMDALGMAHPERCVYVGDRPYDDISGAKGIGMRAVLVPHSDIPAVQQVPVDVHPDGVIQSLADLPDLLADW